jgi:RimJ/RimL family protein N-acetyltransferase
VVDGNETAVRLYESCGFQRFGLEKDTFKFGDGYFDVAYYALHLEG